MENSVLLELISTIKSFTMQDKTFNKLCIFLGAGADIASGGILFSDLKKKCLRYKGISLPSDPSQFAIDETFDAYFQSLPEYERCIILERLLRETRGLHPSDGYKLLVLMAREKIISSVVTTNFDCLLETAEAEMGIDAFQVFAPGVALPSFSSIRHGPPKAIYLKMHGDVDGHLVTHLTSDEINTKEYQEEYRNLLKELLLHNTIVIAGYSGYDKKIADIFSEIIDNISTVFWCNPSLPNPKAPLVKVLSDAKKLHFIQVGFDMVMGAIAGDVFRDRTIFYADSIFIWPLIKAKIKKNQKNFLNHIPPHLFQAAIVRATVLKEYNQYLSQKRYNLFVLSGQRGTGKTTFISQILNQDEADGLYVVPLTAPGTLTPDAPTYLLENLGYVTSTSVSVLYQMAEWMRENDYNIIFAFDSIGNSNIGEKQIAQYISAIVEVAYILRHISNIKFMISLRDEYWERAKNYLDSNYLKEIMWTSDTNHNMSACTIGAFSNEELFLALQNINPNLISRKDFEQMPEEVRTLLCDPFFCGLASENPNSLKRLLSAGQVGLISMLDQFLKSQDLTFIEKRRLQDIACKMLHANSSKIPSADYQDELTASVRGIIEQTEEYISFRHPLYWKYYLVRYYQTNDVVEKTSSVAFEQMLQIFAGSATALPIKESFVLYLSSSNENIDKVFVFLSRLLSFTKHNNANFARVSQLVNEVLQNLAVSCPQKVLEWIRYIDSNSTAFLTLSQRIAYSTIYMDDEVAYQILDKLRIICSNPVALECFVLINDRFTHRLRELELGLEQDYINKYVFALKTSNPLISIIQLVWLMGRIGLDNVDERKYTQIAAEVKRQIGVFSKTCITKENAVSLKKSFIRNAYMIFFNANNDLEEKYYCYSAKSDVTPIIKKVIYEQSGLTENQLNIIRSCINHFDEPIDFFVCNLLFIESAIQNPLRSETELKTLYNSFCGEANVVELDFYLSALFQSQYVINPRSRQFYLTQFKRAVRDYETVLFKSPANERVASRFRFSDLLDLEFEDGFNALTNYSYTAPGAYLIKRGENIDEYLEVYWNLLNTLEKTGSYREIVRLLQAINQMIVNWPVEGFMALRKFIPTKHPVIHQALIKILSQNYLRYPRVTKQFVEEMKNELSSEELQQIYGSTDSHIQYRTLEQLQWARMIYYLHTWIDPDIVKHTLSVILSTDTLESALVKEVTLLQNLNNGETEY